MGEKTIPQSTYRKSRIDGGSPAARLHILSLVTVKSPHPIKS